MLATDPSPVKVEVRGLNVLTQEQYLVQPLWEKISPLLIHSLTSNGEQPLTVGRCRRGSCVLAAYCCMLAAYLLDTCLVLARCFLRACCILLRS